jgi:hypothetical protein
VLTPLPDVLSRLTTLPRSSRRVTVPLLSVVAVPMLRPEPS